MNTVNEMNVDAIVSILRKKFWDDGFRCVPSNVGFTATLPFKGNVETLRKLQASGLTYKTEVRHSMYVTVNGESCGVYGTQYTVAVVEFEVPEDWYLETILQDELAWQGLAKWRKSPISITDILNKLCNPTTSIYW